MSQQSWVVTAWIQVLLIWDLCQSGSSGGKKKKSVMCRWNFNTPIVVFCFCFPSFFPLIPLFVHGAMCKRWLDFLGMVQPSTAGIPKKTENVFKINTTQGASENKFSFVVGYSIICCRFFDIHSKLGLQRHASSLIHHSQLKEISNV